VAAAVIAAVVAAVAAGSAAAAGIQVDVVPNFAGAGLGSTTEWMGAKERIWALAPGGRVALENNRFVEVYGPMADMNVLDSPNWEFGPFAAWRFGRSGVTDPVVGLLPEIDGGLEAGVFAGWHYVRTEGVPYRLRLGVSLVTGVSGGATGSNVTPYASLWFPLGPTVFVGLGAGFTWASESFMQQRFGISSDASAASGLPIFKANAGVRQLYAWPALLIKLSPHWYAGAGAFWQRITGDGAASPIVTGRGERDQITAGIGLGYSW
jgi:outer membrane protein